MATYTGLNVGPRTATRVSDGALAPPEVVREARELETLRTAQRTSEAALLDPPGYEGALLDPLRRAQRQNVLALVNPPRFAGVLRQPLRRGASLRENSVIKGVLRDALDRPLAGWLLLVGAGLPNPETGTIAIVAARLAGTDEAGAWSTVLQRTGTYTGLAWKEGEHVVPLECEVAAFDGIGSVDFRAPVTFREGLAFVAGTTTLLRGVRLAWTDPAERKAWQGTRTDAQGAYSLYEEQRAYEVFAIQTDAKTRALYRLSEIVDNADGTRDLYFLLLATEAIIEFGGYTGGFVKKYASDGTFQNLPPEWDFGGGA